MNYIWSLINFWSTTQVAKTLRHKRKMNTDPRSRIWTVTYNVEDYEVDHEKINKGDAIGLHSKFSRDHGSISIYYVFENKKSSSYISSLSNEDYQVVNKTTKAKYKEFKELKFTSEHIIGMDDDLQGGGSDQTENKVIDNKKEDTDNEESEDEVTKDYSNSQLEDLVVVLIQQKRDLKRKLQEYDHIKNELDIKAKRLRSCHTKLMK